MKHKIEFHIVVKRTDRITGQEFLIQRSETADEIDYLLKLADEAFAAVKKYSKDVITQEEKNESK